MFLQSRISNLTKAKVLISFPNILFHYGLLSIYEFGYITSLFLKIRENLSQYENLATVLMASHLFYFLFFLRVSEIVGF